MLIIGDKFPDYNRQAVISLEKGKEFQEINEKRYPGKWQVVFFWTMDFTFICPTEIAEFGKRNSDFAEIYFTAPDVHQLGFCAVGTELSSYEKNS